MPFAAKYQIDGQKYAMNTCRCLIQISIYCVGTAFADVLFLDHLINHLT